MPTVRTRKQTNYGYPNLSADQAQEPIVANRAPTTNDGAELGTIWVDKSANDFRILCDNTAGSFSWTGVTGGATTLTSLTVNPGNAVITAGDLTVTAGTTTVGALVAGATTITGNVGITGDLTVTGAGAMTITTGAGIDVDAATASSYVVTGAGQDLTLGAIGGSLKLNATEDAAGAVEVIANGGTSETIVLNAQQGTGAGSIALQSDAGGVTISAATQVVIDGAGDVSVAPDTATVASPTASSTQNFRVITATFTGFTTAAAASQDFTIVSSDILATSGMFVQVANLNASTNGAIMTLDGVTQAAGQIVVSTTNNGAGALGAGDNVLISVWVIS